TSRHITQGELVNRVTLAKSLFINCDLRVGETIREEMLVVKSPGRGLQPNRRAELVGRRVKRDMQKGDVFYPSDLDAQVIQPRRYSFNRPWGVPVRYYDFKEILGKSNPDFLEFHLSYKDMDIDFHQFFDQPCDLDFTVHSPDIFRADHLLNPSASDPHHRQRSLSELQRVIDIARELKPYFRRATTPLVIASMGGFTRDRLVTPAERADAYALLAESLKQLDTEGVELIPQTLPPFPWYFGGQLYLNLFVDYRDTADFCEQYGYRLCFDTCHSMLACNHFGWSFDEFVKAVAPYTAHLHISDARGVDGEGLQIGEGDIDMRAMWYSLNHEAPRVSFIPEIWQGHENGGEGFWIALERLEMFLS
ncbi:MAG: TIM barrel protein, partial [Chloroflexota bacterium]